MGKEMQTFDVNLAVPLLLVDPKNPSHKLTDSHDGQAIVRTSALISPKQLANTHIYCIP